MSTVLVLNYDYTPLNVTSIRRGFVLVDKGKAEVIKSDESPIITGYKTYVRPLIIRLLKYIRHHVRTLRASRPRIYKRDNYECVYCGCDNRKTLTLDHVIPQSKGGKDAWDNLVTACKRCNSEKSNLTVDEYGKAIPKPSRPHYLMMMKKVHYVPTEWDDYVSIYFSQIQS